MRTRTDLERQVTVGMLLDKLGHDLVKLSQDNPDVATILQNFELVRNFIRDPEVRERVVRTEALTSQEVGELRRATAAVDQVVRKHAREFNCTVEDAVLFLVEESEITEEDADAWCRTNGLSYNSL